MDDFSDSNGGERPVRSSSTMEAPSPLSSILTRRSFRLIFLSNLFSGILPEIRHAL